MQIKENEMTPIEEIIHVHRSLAHALAHEQDARDGEVGGLDEACQLVPSISADDAIAIVREMESEGVFAEVEYGALGCGASDPAGCRYRLSGEAYGVIGRMAGMSPDEIDLATRDVATWCPSCGAMYLAVSEADEHDHQ